MPSGPTSPAGPAICGHTANPPSNSKCLDPVASLCRPGDPTPQLSQRPVGTPQIHRLTRTALIPVASLCRPGDPTPQLSQRPVGTPQIHRLTRTALIQSHPSVVPAFPLPSRPGVLLPSRPSESWDPDGRWEPGFCRGHTRQDVYIIGRRWIWHPVSHHRLGLRLEIAPLRSVARGRRP